jgi:hypothetical protein
MAVGLHRKPCHRFAPNQCRIMGFRRATPPGPIERRKRNMTDTILHVLCAVVRWRFFLIPVFILVPLLSIASVQQGGRGIWRPLVMIPLGIILGISNVLAGPDLAAVLIHDFGVQAPATVTGTYATGNIYNDRQVMGHNVLIKTADGSTIEANFEDDDFNVYPPANSVTYPQDGDQFNVSHLKGYPANFVIISNDDSPWANSLRCYDLMSALRQANSKRQFAPESAPYRKAYEEAVQAARAAGCDTGDNTDDN